MAYQITLWTAAITDNGEDIIIAENPDKENMPFQFRLKDDDDIIYGYGYSDDCSSEAAFAPLDDYESAYGCTSIEYLNEDTGEWEQL